MAPVHQSWIHGMLEGLDRADLNALHGLLGKLKKSFVKAQDEIESEEGM